MPIIHFHLVDGSYGRDQEARLLVEASRLYARVLDCPMDRIRAFILSIPPARAAVGGTLVADGGSPAPYFEFLVLEGRPSSQRLALLRGFTDLLAEVLGADKASIRGQCRQVPPEDWAIGGRPASQAREADIAAFTTGRAG